MHSDPFKHKPNGEEKRMGERGRKRKIEKGWEESDKEEEESLEGERKLREEESREGINKNEREERRDGRKMEQEVIL